MIRSTAELLARLKELSELKAGWHDGEGLPPSPLAIDRAQSLAVHFKTWDPKVFADEENPGVFFEWVAGCASTVIPNGPYRKCELEVRNSGEYIYRSWWMDGNKGDDWVRVDFAGRNAPATVAKFLQFEHSQERA